LYISIIEAIFYGNYEETATHQTEGTKRYKFASRTIDVFPAVFASNNVADWWQHWCFRFRSKLELEVESSD
jgi:hypothetical protein